MFEIMKMPSYFFEHRLYYPLHFKLYFKDLVRFKKRIIADNKQHVKAAIDWLLYAQDITRDGGVSAGYFFSSGWKASYPETTGYIIPSFFDYYHITKHDEYWLRAIKMSNWLLNVQLDNGAFPGGILDTPREPLVFDTGQAMHGLIRSYYESNDNKYKVSAIKAGDWLIEVQDKNGSWKRFSFNKIRHTYHTRVAWPLLELYEATRDPKYKVAAVKNIEWALGNQKMNGWFKNCAFNSSSDPFTHNIAYTARGILESGVLLNNRNYIEAAIKTAFFLLRAFEVNGYLAGRYNENWESTDKYSCLVGDAQTSVIWLRLFEIEKDTKYLNAATKQNDYLKATQDIFHPHRVIRGAIKGSHPIYGEYSPFEFLNWAAKFFIDALLLQEKLKSVCSEK